MKPDRQQLIESLVTGNITDLLKKSPYKYVFTVELDNNPDGTTSFKLNVKDLTINPAGCYNRSGIGNWEDTLTTEEKKYLELCQRIRRICCFEYTTNRNPQKRLLRSGVPSGI